jgi:hypothetical protein
VFHAFPARSWFGPPEIGEGIFTFAALLSLIWLSMPGAWIESNALSLLAGSLNPADVAGDLARPPQIHFVGGMDTNVAPSVVEAFASRFVSRACLEIVIVANLGHGGGWADIWPRLVQREPRCVRPA